MYFRLMLGLAFLRISLGLAGEGLNPKLLLSNSCALL